MKIEMGKEYQTRDGRKIEILKVDVDNDKYSVIALITDKVEGKYYQYPFTYTKDGRNYFDNPNESPNDLIEVKKTFSYSQWVNVYSDGQIGYMYDTKEESIEACRDHIVACVEVKVEGTYGDGL